MNAPAAMLSFVFPPTGAELRGFEHEGDPWFMAQDVCAMLGYTNTSLAVSKLDDDEKGIYSAYTAGGAQNVLIVSESGLWYLVIRSRREEAKKIRRWITEVVLPTIRKTGRFDMASNDVEEEGSKGVGIADTLGLEGPDDIERMRVKIGLIREARHVYGPKSARGLWEAIGLPIPEALEQVLVPPPPWGRVCLDHLDPTIRDWMEARCDLQPGWRTRGKALHNDYTEWCEAQDREACGLGTFGRQLERAGLRAFHSNGTWRKGIRLKD